MSSGVSRQVPVGKGMQGRIQRGLLCHVHGALLLGSVCAVALLSGCSTVSETVSNTVGKLNPFSSSDKPVQTKRVEPSHLEALRVDPRLIVGGAIPDTPAVPTVMAQIQPDAPAATGSAQRIQEVFFDFDSAAITPETQAGLQALAKSLANGGIKVRIEGNTDERGSKEYNLALGQRRANAVADMLRANGLAEQRIEAVSYGEEHPRKKGHDETAWKENRRVDFRYAR